MVYEASGGNIKNKTGFGGFAEKIYDEKAFWKNNSQWDYRGLQAEP